MYRPDRRASGDNGVSANGNADTHTTDAQETR